MKKSIFCRFAIAAVAIVAALLSLQTLNCSKYEIFVNQTEMMIFLPGENCHVIASYAFLYSQADFGSERINVDGEFVTLPRGTSVQVENAEGDFVYVSCDLGQGYVYQYYLSQSESLTVYPVFNGSVKVDGAIVYDIDGQNSGFAAKAGQGVYIYNGFKDQGDFTSLQIVLADGSLYNGLMKNGDIKPDGVSGLLIVGISIIACCATIILTIVFLKKKKKVKKSK